jgi:hypothetical protein
MSYKVTNRTEMSIKGEGKVLFKPNETKILAKKPYSDFFIVEEIK